MSYYKKGQLIWAKIKGYPWWPGVVAKANSDKYGNLDKEVVVNFIGENSHAVLTQDKVADFAEKRKQHSLSKNKKLQESIQIADKILEGSLTYEQERSRLEDLEDSSSEESGSGSEDSSDGEGGGDQEKEVKSNRSSSSKKSKSDSVSISEAVWKDTESLLGTKSAKKSDGGGSESSDGSSDESRSITSDRPSLKDKQKAKKLEEKKAKQEKRKEAEKKLKKKKSLDGGKISKSSSLPPESTTKGKKASVDKTKHSKNPKEPTPLKSRKIKGKLLIDEDGETENFWKSPQKFSKEADENNSEAVVVRKKKNKKLTIDSTSEISQTDKMGIIPPAAGKTGGGAIEVEEETASASRNEIISTAANIPSEPPHQKEEFNNDVQEPEPEEEGVKKKLKLENSFVEISKIEEEDKEEEKEKPQEKPQDRARENILKRFEKDLEELLRQISNKVKASIKMNDRDSDILKLLQTMEEFESKEIQGSELVNTKIGKIYKTIHFVLIRHKSHLPDNCDIIITTLAKILHIIKNKIMKYSMDNSEYLQLLKIIPENEKIEPSLINLLDINFEKIRMKVEVEENISNQPPLPLLAKATADVKESLYASLDTETLRKTPSLLTDIQNIPQSIIKEDLMEEEEQHVEDNMTSIPLRKKVCKKLAKVLQKCYLLEKNNAQELTIQIEDKLNRLNNGKENEYKQTIKVLHKLMKARRLKLDELNKFSSLDEIFKSKIQTNQRNEFTKKT